MKKYIYLFFTIIFFVRGSFATNWYDLDYDMSVDLDRITTKGNYLYIKIKYNNIKTINDWLEKESPGVLLDTNIVSYMVNDTIVDCKNPRYKVPLTLLYSKNTTIINKIKNNTWYNDLTRSDWGAYCDLYDRLKTNPKH